MPAIFPRWTNEVPRAIGVVGLLGAIAATGVIWYWFSPWYTDVGYRPEQPVPFSHKLHAGEMGMDCRYCHNTVERADMAAIPPTATCMNCHSQVKTDSPQLARIRDSHESGEAVPWVRVHQLPDYAFFSHQPHIAAGVGCESCHGRIDTMTVVQMGKPLSMGWCLECHRNPGPNLRPTDQVTTMGWDAEEAGYDYKKAKRSRTLEPPTHCSGCHR